MDYRDGRKYIEDKEEMFTIGNNDLCGRPDCELTDGEDDTSKFNLVNVLRYYTFELDPYNVDETGHSNYYGVYGGKDHPIFSLYSFNYGWWHFISLVSEIRGYYYLAFDDVPKSDMMVFSKAMNVTIEKWLLKDLMMFKNASVLKDLNGRCSNCIIYMHEMPFTITTAKAVHNKKTQDRSANTQANINAGKGSGCHLNIEGNGVYRISRLFKKLGIKAVLGGHKHTFAVSKPIYDAPLSSDGSTIFPDDNLDIDHDPFLSTDCSLAITNKPIIEIPVGGEQKATNIGRYHEVDEFTAPTYIMSQATGFKLVSNKELPPPTPPETATSCETDEGETVIPWLLSYYPASKVKDLTALTAYAMQYKPMYIKYTLDAELSTINFAAY